MGVVSHWLLTHLPGVRHFVIAVAVGMMIDGRIAVVVELAASPQLAPF